VIGAEDRNPQRVVASAEEEEEEEDMTNNSVSFVM
jgi:hypothetical protein